MADVGETWAESMHESLRLSRFNTPPPGAERTPTRVLFGNPQGTTKSEQNGARMFASAIHVAASAGPSVRCFSEPPRLAFVHDAIPSPADTTKTDQKEETAKRPMSAVSEAMINKEDQPRSSVHLPDLRISHHLRSASLMSWDKVADAADLPPVPPIFRDRTVSEHSRSSQQANRSRHHRQTSSTGFASARVPVKWGNVVAHNPQREDMSSIYSSRPHSPPDSFGGSMANLSLPRAAESILEVPRSRSNNLLIDNDETPRPSRACSGTSVDMPRSPSNNYLSENDETPRPFKRHGILNTETTMKHGTESVTGAGQPKIARKNSVATTKKSKFREEFSPTPPRKRSTPTISFMKILRHRNEVRSQSEANLRCVKSSMGIDGSYDETHGRAHRERAMSQSLLSMQKEQESFGKEKEANPVWQKALKSYQEEKSSLLLPGNRAMAGQTSPFRERSSSVSVRAKSTHSLTPAPSKLESVSDETPGTTHMHTPLEGAPGGIIFPPTPLSRRAALVHADEERPDSIRALQMAFDKQTDTKETVGAWGRYPSHTRHERTGSAGHADSVQTRDFALEAAIYFAKGKHMEESIDPTARPESPTDAGGKKRKKRVGSGRMAKSASMTFTKTFKNYTKRFRSQSTEFHRHGYGHRSSIAAGGVLEHPELEVLPQVWAVPIVEDREHERSNEERSVSVQKEWKKTPDDATNDKSEVSSPSSQTKSSVSAKVKGKQKAEDSAATLRPPRATERNLAALDGVADTETSADRARVWSVYYEECIAPFPRASTDLASLSQPNLRVLAADAATQTLDLTEFGARRVNSSNRGHGSGTGTERQSFESRCTSVRSMSMKSYTFPRRYVHSRHASHLSRVSVASRGSVLTSFVSSGAGGDGYADSGDAKSVASVGVRRSTMDLLNVYREQEIAERERVLSLMRGESIRVAVA